MPDPEASYPTETCPTCGKYPALRGRSCFVCFTGAVVGEDGSLLKPTTPAGNKMEAGGDA